MRSNYVYKTARRFLLLIIALVIVQKSYALPNGYENRFIEGFRYGLYVPPDYNPEKKYHLLVYLHGYSDTTSWDFSWYTKEFQAKFPCIVLSPKCLTSYSNGWGNSWGMVESYASRMAFRIIDDLLKNYTIDQSKMHICGTSMGGFGVFYALASHPGMFASAYATCGGGDPTTASLLVNTPLWIFHGGSDNVVPVTQSRNMYAAILAAGGTHVRYTEYPGVAHDSWNNVNKEKTLDRWLFSQQKGTMHEISPDPVASFQCSLNSNNRPNLIWSAPADESTDDKTVWCYRIYRNSALFATLNNDKFFFVDSSALSGIYYDYSISAVNNYFHESARSFNISITTPVNLTKENLEASRALFSVYPNPVIDKATFSFDLERPGHVKIKIYDSIGQMVEKLTNKVYPQGAHLLEWNVQKYSKGLYEGVFESKGKKFTIKILVK